MFSCEIFIIEFLGVCMQKEYEALYISEYISVRSTIPNVSRMLPMNKAVTAASGIVKITSKTHASLHELDGGTIVGCIQVARDDERC